MRSSLLAEHDYNISLLVCASGRRGKQFGRPRRDAQVAHAAGKMAGALQAMNQPAAMPGLAVNLKQREWELDRA